MARTTERFTIVTPVYNGMPWLPDAMRSVDRQRNRVAVEHLVFDAGSTDGSREWLQSHTGADTVLVFEPDAGQTDALMKGFDLASGGIIGWLNSDDLFEDDALFRVGALFDAHPDAALVSGCALYINADGAITGAIPTPPVSSFEGLLRHPKNLAQPSTFFRLGAYRQARGLDRSLDLAMDVDLWMQLAQVGDVILAPSEVFSRFRLHRAAKSVKGAGAATLQDLAVRRRHGLSMRSATAAILLTRGLVANPVRGALRDVVRRRE